MITNRDLAVIPTEAARAAARLRATADDAREVDGHGRAEQHRAATGDARGRPAPGPADGSR
jgi:hypothetical protein